MNEPNWDAQVLSISRIEKVFLTNDFDDPLEGFDTNLYVPCLRTDDLVFHFAQASVQSRLQKATGCSLGTSASVRQSLEALLERFIQRGARECAISLPPGFVPKSHVSQSSSVQIALDDLMQRGMDSSDNHK